MSKRSLFECRTKAQVMKELFNLYSKSFNGEKNIYESKKCFLESVVNDLKDPNCPENDEIIKEKCRNLLIIVKTNKNRDLYLLLVTLVNTIILIFNLIVDFFNWSLKELNMPISINLLLVFVLTIFTLCYLHYNSRCTEYIYEILLSDNRFMTEDDK